MIAWTRRTALRLWALIRRDRAEAELARELAAHLTLLEDDYRRQGLAPAAAARAARQALGGVDRTVEAHRDTRSVPWLEDARHDLRHAWRALVKAPGVALAAVVTLALGLGATTAIATLTYAVLVRPLPFGPAPERLVRLLASTPNPLAADAPPRRVPVAFSLDEAQDLDASTGAIDGAGLWMPTVVGLAGFDDAGHVGAARVSASTLALLDARPLLGRILGPDDDAGASGAALLGETAWRRWFGADPAVVGRSIVVQTVLGRRSSQTVVIVGILPSAFAFPTADTALWLSLPPAGPQPYRAPLLARLSPGATPEATLDALGPAVRAVRGHGPDVRYELTREQDQLVGPVRPALLALTAAVAVLLLIAALNVTNLLLARALARGREFSLRAALGASRGRLIRQGLTESVALGVAGGLAGLAVAAASVSTFRRLAAPLARIDLGTTGVGWGATTFPRLSEAGLDGGIVAAALGLAMAVGLGVGLGAAWRAGHAGAGQTLRVTGATAAAGGRAGRLLRRGLVVAQVAGALPLLVGAVMLARSLQHLAATDPGFSTANVLTFQVSLPVAAYPDARLQVFAEALVDDIRQRPGVRHAGYANQVPMVALRDTAGGLWTTPDAGRAFAPDAADARLVSRDYLAAIGVRVVAGRGFDVRDGAGQPRVLLVNEALARRQFPGRDPVGLTVYVGRDITPWAIVGVVADVRQFGLDRAPEPQFFADLRQWQSGMPIFPTGAYFVVATDGRPEALVPDIHALVRELDGAAALFNTAGLDAIVASTLTRPRLYAVVLAAFAAIGALLAGIGLYGVLAFLVLERTPEIGVRLALGASRGAVLRQGLRQGLSLVGLGLGVGLVGARALERALSSLLYGVQPGEATTTVAAATIFMVVAVVAILVPAWRATRIDPLTAIRSE